METVKLELIDRINKMTNENIIETKQQIDKLFEFVELSKSIWKTVPNFILPNETVNATAIQIDNNNNNNDETTVSTVTANEIAIEDILKNSDRKLIITNEPVPLERRLRGGVIRRNDTTLYVPEKIIRTNGWVHGDYILATGDNEQDLTYEKVSESTTADKSSRVELDYCLISESETGKLVINQQIIDGALKPSFYNNIEHEFTIETSNAANFKLQNGDVVTIAFYASKPQEFKIIWVYTDITEPTPAPAPKPSSFYKESSVEKKVKWNESEKELLSGKKLVIVGADFRAKDFQELADNAGLITRVLSGDESDARFEAAVRGKDLIVSLSSHSSHRSSELAKTFAKKYAIPFRAAPTSVSSVKRAIVHGFSAKNIPFHSLF